MGAQVGLKKERPRKATQSHGGVLHSSVIALEQIAGFTGDHDRRCVGVRPDQAWHDWAVANPYAFDAIHPQQRIDQSHVVPTHLAGACWVVGRATVLAGVIFVILMGFYTFISEADRADVFLQAVKLSGSEQS